MESELDWFSPDEAEEIVWQGEPKMNSIYPALAIGIILIPVGIGLVIILGSYLHIKKTDYLISNEGLYKKKGILSRKIQKIGFSKIQDTSFSQGIFGKHFEYGNVDISTAGGERVEMRYGAVENPKEVQQMINQRIKTEKTSEKGSQEEVNKQILEELSGIRKELEKVNEEL